MAILFNIIKELSAFSILAPLLYSLSLLRTTKHRLILQIFWFSVLIALVEAGGWITAAHQQNNLWMSHVYVPVEYAILAFIYYYAFDAASVRRLILISIIFFFLFSAFNVLYLEGLTTYNSYPRSIESVFMVGLAMLYFYQKLKRIDQKELFDDPYFMLSAGVMFYFAVSSVYNSLFNVMLDYPREYMMLSMIAVNFSNIIFNIVLVLVLRRVPKG
ncbi:hypothetical protein [Pontibacter beigongshangensis]|uniref:hypothetical protein n=1 Tax=Pontibacter beigongshangensis TaxID=2574733 RepID=UPI0016500701|nr:hypothetical protein [Pontibacter beigongshangensis]